MTQANMECRKAGIDRANRCLGNDSSGTGFWKMGGSKTFSTARLGGSWMEIKLMKHTQYEYKTDS